MVHFYADWIISFQWTRHITAINCFLFVFLGTLFWVQMILKHLKGFGLFTSAHINIYDAVRNTLLMMRGGEAKAGLNFPMA